MTASACGISTARRLNWGCGPRGRAGWVNADLRPGDGIAVVGDILDGLPLPDDVFDYVVSIHALQDVPYAGLARAVRELRRVLKVGGALRLAVPDLDRAIDAYQRRDASYFYIHDDESKTLGGKFSIQMTWYGSVRSLFNAEFLMELLVNEAFREVRRCAFQETISGYPEIVELDNRPRESLFMEAIK